MHGYFSVISVLELLGESERSSPDESRQWSLQNEIFKEVSNHDVIRQVKGFPVSF